MNFAELASVSTSKSLTLGEKITLGTNTALIGIIVVFSILVVLIILISLLSRILSIKKPSSRNDASTDIQNLNMVETISFNNDESFDESIVAAITAAIMCCLQTENRCDLVVSSIRRTGKSSPSWNMAGRDEYLSSRL
jgi:sodium pump decarboxylase gamma subunit